MSYQRGTNSGLSGIISIPGVSALFEVRIYRWSPRMVGATKPRRGRGGGVFRTLRWMMSAGTGACSGKPNLDGWPAPDAWKGQTGTLTVQVHSNKTVAYPVLITEMGFKYDEKTQDLPDVFFTWEITGLPTYTGWGSGSQPSATDPSKADQEQWEGTSKTKDTGNLDSIAIRVTDVWGSLTDTDGAEYTKLAAVIAAAQAPFSGMKLNTAVFARDALDGGTVTETWQLTTSDERVINEATTLTVDPNGRTSQAVTAAFNTTPAASSGLVSRGLTTKEYNDNQILYTKQHGTRSTIEDLTFGNTKTFHDVSVLAEEDLFCVSFTTGSPPADPTPPVGKVIVEYFDVPDTSPSSTNLSYRVYVYGLVSNSQKQTLARYELSTDPFLLENTKRSAVIWDSSGSAPADPGVPSGMVLINKTDVGIPTHSTKQIRAYRWGQRTSADDLTFGRTKISIDRNSIKIGQESYTAELITTGDAYSAPSAPSVGMVNTDYFDVPATNASASNKSVRVYVWSLTTNGEKLTLPRYANEVDPNGLDTSVRSGTIWDGTTPPSDPALTGIRSGLKLVSKTDIGIPSHPTTLIRVYLHEKNDSIDKRVLPHVVLTADPSNIISNGEVAALNSTPSVPGGYKALSTTGFYQNGTDILNVTKYALQSEADKITQPGTIGGGDWEEGYLHTATTLAATASSAATQAAAILSSNLSDKTFNRVRVEQLNDGLSRVWIERQADTVVVDFEMETRGWSYVLARLSSTDVYVYLSYFRKIGQNAGGTAIYEGCICPTRYLGVRMPFTISRRTTGSSVPLNLSFAGAANSASFLGLPANTVIYTGDRGRARIDTSGNAVGVSYNRLNFTYDNLGYFDMGDIPEGKFQIAGSYGSYVSTRGAWRKATDLGFTPVLLNTGDFTGAYT